GVQSTADRMRATATLARILLWQGRIDEAAALELPGAEDTDDSFAFVEATAVRVLLACGSVFEAGHRARELLTTTARLESAVARVQALIAHLRVLAIT